MDRPPSSAGGTPARTDAPPTRVSASLQALGGQFDLRQALVVFRAHALVALAITVVACTLLGWEQMRRPRIYAASASVSFERRERVIDLKRFEESPNSEPYVVTRLADLRSAELAAYVEKTLTPAERERIVAPYMKGRPPQVADRMVSGIVRSSMSADRVPETFVLAITVTHQDPEVAAMLANRYADQFIRYLYDKSTANSNAGLSFLRDQAEDLRKKLEASERSLQEYRTRFNLVSLDDSQNIVVDRLKALNTSATAARVRRSELDVRLQQVEAAIVQKRNPVELVSLLGSAAVADLQRKIDDLVARRTVLADRYGRRHPAMLEIDRTLETLQKLRDDQVKTSIASLRTQRDKALAEEQDLTNQLATAESDSLKLDQIGVEYGVLKRAIETQKSIYSQVLSRLNEASISAQLESVNLRIASRAQPNGTPISPNLRKTAMLLVLLAVVILAGYPFCAEMLFARVRSGLDVESYLGAVLLGEISSVRAMAEKDRPHLVRLESEEHVAEQFRSLFSQFQLVSKVAGRKAILITSTIPSEGKSFIASNLAAAFVAHGKRVLLIDADLRRPTQHRSLGLENKAGMLLWLEKGGNVTDDVERDPLLGLAEISPGLFLLRTGGSSRRASEIVSGGRLDVLIAALQAKFDILVFDTPPAGVFPDAVAFARYCEELILVCRFGVAARQQVRTVYERMRQTGKAVAGIVLNALPSGRGTGYYYYHSYGSADRYSKYYSKDRGEKA